MANISTHSPIKLLPENIIDQIKAGEVIERPANVIKELFENAIDANATKIDLHISDNGIDFISIEDNGIGITKEDIPFAFLRHATSKINSFHDLYGLNSYGFRGEALASLASISKITCISKTTNSSSAIQYIIEGGMERSINSIDREKIGTSIYIKDLFYNTPARLKFIKSKHIEKRQIMKMWYSFVISNPKISFSIRFGDNNKKTFHRENQKNRILNIFKTSNIELLHNSQEYENYQASIYLSSNVIKNNSHKYQYLFINNRFINDQSIIKNIYYSLKSHWQERENHNYVVFLTIPLDHLDINVHPNKSQVKLYKKSIVMGLLSSIVKEIYSSKSDISLINKETIENENENENVNENENENVNENENNIDIDNYFHFDDNAPLKTIVKQNLDLIHLSQHYYIFNNSNKNKKYILNLKSILNFHIFINYKNTNFIIEENNLTPILVGTTLENINLKNSCLMKLKEFGFILDNIKKNLDNTNKYFILRAIPSFLTNFPIEQFLRTLIIFLEKNTINNNNQIMMEFLNNFFIPDIELIPTIILNEIILDKINIIENTNDNNQWNKMLEVITPTIINKKFNI